MCNTGCNVDNGTTKRLLYIVDGEDVNHTLLIRTQDELSFKGTSADGRSAPQPRRSHDCMIDATDRYLRRSSDAIDTRSGSSEPSSPRMSSMACTHGPLNGSERPPGRFRNVSSESKRRRRCDGKHVMRCVEPRRAALAVMLAAGLLLTACGGGKGDAVTDYQPGSSFNEPSYAPEPDGAFNEPSYAPEPNGAYDEPSYAPEPDPGSTLHLPYEPSIVPGDDPPGIKHCLFAGDALCDSSIDVPPPLLAPPF
jgi:hypothetical protein